MMSAELFREDSYLQDCNARVVAVDGDAVVLDQTVFYPMGGGQPGDTGTLSWAGGSAAVIDTRYGSAGAIQHILGAGSAAPLVGDAVYASLDWGRRYRHMRMHTALHLLGSILHYGVTGGNITADKSRLDFDMEDNVDREAVAAQLEQLVAGDNAVSCRWITAAELDAQPELVRTMSVQPPRGTGRIRLLEIAGVDLQPCGGTHVRSTGEVGRVRIGKIEKKGKRNRRVNIHLDD